MGAATTPEEEEEERSRGQRRPLYPHEDLSDEPLVSVSQILSEPSAEMEARSWEDEIESGKRRMSQTTSVWPTNDPSGIVRSSL